MCEYCKKVNNTELLGHDANSNSGLSVSISYRKKEKKGYINASGWFDTYVGIEPLSVEINYCPMCGRELRNNKVLEEK